MLATLMIIIIKFYQVMEYKLHSSTEPHRIIIFSGWVGLEGLYWARKQLYHKAQKRILCLLEAAAADTVGLLNVGIQHICHLPPPSPPTLPRLQVPALRSQKK